jgi:uncharacterized protein YjbI with pentapeptide repeats
MSSERSIGREPSASPLTRADVELRLRRGQPAAPVDLSFHNLEQCNLSYLDLQCADLNGTDLRHAVLRGANLQGADLSTALLHGPELHGAILHRDQLWGARGKQAGRTKATEKQLTQAPIKLIQAKSRLPQEAE